MSTSTATPLPTAPPSSQEPPGDPPAQPAPQTDQTDLEKTPWLLQLRALNQQCLFLYVSTPCWPGRLVMREGKTRLGDQDVDDSLATKGGWRLLPDEWSKRLGVFPGRARAVITRHHGSLFHGSVYVVPRVDFASFLGQVDQVRQDYLNVVEEFLKEWPALLRERLEAIAAKHGPEQAQDVARRVPQGEKMRDRFSLRVGRMPIGADLGALLARQEEGAGPEVLAQDVLAWSRTFQEDTKAILQEAVQGVVREPQEALAECLDTVLAAIDQERSISEPTLERLRREWSRLQGFAFLSPASLQAVMDQVTPQLAATTARGISKQDALGKPVLAKLRQVQAALQEVLDPPEPDAQGKPNPWGEGLTPGKEGEGLCIW